MQSESTTKFYNGQVNNCPRVTGWLHTRQDLVVVNCPYCHEEHRHGVALGARVSHCEQGPRQEYFISIIARKRTKAEQRPRKWRYDVIE